MPSTPQKNGAVIVTAASRDSKLTRGRGDDVAATYAAQQTCHSDCPLKDAGCYAQEGRMNLHTMRVNGHATRRKQSPAKLRAALARREAAAIRQLDGRQRLRVHVVGDCATAPAAATVGRAMVAHTRKHGRDAWTYTHSWRRFHVDAWAGAAVLASCEDPADVARANARGYVAALIVPPHPTNKVYTHAGVRVIPCPAQFTRGGQLHTAGAVRAVVCSECNLCSRPAILRRHGLTVGFAPDGQTHKRIIALLPTEAR